MDGCDNCKNGRAFGVFPGNIHLNAPTYKRGGPACENGYLPEREYLVSELKAAREELATATDALREQIEARRVTEAEGGALQQMNTEIDRLRGLLMVALPHVEASAGASHMLDGFRPRKRPIDDAVEEIRAALQPPAGSP